MASVEQPACPGGVLWMASVHRNFDSAGIDRTFADSAAAAVRAFAAGELTGRTETAVRRALDEACVIRRGAGAPPIAREGG